MRWDTPFIAAITASTLIGCGPSKSPDTIHPRIVFGSQPVSVNEVQDAIVWTHPTDPAKSLIFITNEKKGLEVHDVNGLLLKHLDVGIEPVYVDVVYNFPLNGLPTDLVVASCQNEEKPGVRVWSINPAKRKLTPVSETFVLPVFDGGTPIGLCTYHSCRTGRCYFFVTDEQGEIEQWEMHSAASGRVSATLVRKLSMSSRAKGSITDEEFGYVYFAQEKVGLQRFDAEPDGSARSTCVIPVNDHGLLPSIKGPALYGASNGKGYLLAVSEGPKGGRSIANVYERNGSYRFLVTIDPDPTGFGPVDHSSGLAITNQSLGQRFPSGALLLNDQINPNASEDFKALDWADIARRGRLQIDTRWSRRGISSHPKH